MGGVPSLRQMTALASSRLQPLHPQVCLLKLSILSIVRSLAAAMVEHESSYTTVYDAHDPSLFSLGVKSGMVPDEQHTYCRGVSEEQSFESGL
jgi:hypothetical protein